MRKSRWRKTLRSADIESSPTEDEPFPLPLPPGRTTTIRPIAGEVRPTRYPASVSARDDLMSDAQVSGASFPPPSLVASSQTAVSSAAPSLVSTSEAVSAAYPPAAASSAVSMVLRAGLEDCLCHLVELYGPDILDTFLERRINRNIKPIIAHADEMGSSPQGARIRSQAASAERLLRETIESVRKDPGPPSSD